MDNKTNTIDPIWHLHDDLSVEDAAALIANEDPLRIERDRNDFDFSEKYGRVAVVRKAIIGAIKSGKLKATLRYNVAHQMTAWEYDGNGSLDSIGTFIDVMDDENNHYYMCRTPDWNETTIDREELRRWLVSRNAAVGFFFGDKEEQRGYLDPDHARYSAKLAAAVSAWEGYKEIPGKTPKQAMEKWLREHASEFGLVDDDGNPKKTPVDQCSEVANWQIVGGAPRTPQA